MAPPQDKVLNIQQAIAAVEKKELSVLQAAKEFGIPKSTLYDKVKGISSVNSKKGPQCVLSDKNEAILVKWILTCGEAGFPVTKTQVLASVAKLVEELQLDTPFKGNNNVPGRKWYNSFMKRNPMLSLRVPQNLTLSRARVTEEQLRFWFETVKKMLIEERDSYLVSEIFGDDEEENDEIDDPSRIRQMILGDEANDFEILREPSRVFNADEAAFFYNPKGEKVLHKKGAKNVYSVINVDEKECVTVLVNVSAAGVVLPSMVVLKYQRIPAQVASAIPEEWAVGNSESGWMTGETFFEYVANIFEPWLTAHEIKRPVILFVDGHVSHLTLHLSKFCRKNKIILISLLPNSTHLLQPLDVACFRALKKKWLEVATNFRINNMSPVISKTDFFPLLNTAIKEAVTESVIQSGFRKCGLVPWNPDALDYSKIPTVPAPVEGAEPTGETERVPGEIEQVPRESNAPIIDIQNVLNHLNSFLGSDKEEFFRSVKNSSNWMDIVDSEDFAIFKYWRYTFDLAEESAPLVAAPRNETSSNELHVNRPAEGSTVTEILETEILTLDSLIDYDSLVPLTSSPVLVSESANKIKDLDSVINVSGISSILASPLPSLESSSNLTPIQPWNQPSSSTAEEVAAPRSLSFPGVPEQSTSRSPDPEASAKPVCKTFLAPSPNHSTPTVGSSAQSLSSKNEPKTSSLMDSKTSPESLLESSSQPGEAISDKTTIPSSGKAAGNTTKTTSTCKIPSPFKRALPWPGARKPSKHSSNKKAKRELIPVVSAAKWQEFHEKKLKEKEDLEKEKQRKKDEREQKKVEKAAAKETKSKQKIAGKKRKLPSPLPEEELNTDQEDEMGTIEAILQVNDHVIVEYEEEFFPGMVLKREEDKVSVKTMAIAGIEVWKWPLKEDICFYEYADVKMIIKAPQPFGNRGHFKVPEMKTIK